MFLTLFVYAAFFFTFPYTVSRAKPGDKKCNEGKEFCSLQQELPDL